MSYARIQVLKMTWCPMFIEIATYFVQNKLVVTLESHSRKGKHVNTFIPLWIVGLPPKDKNLLDVSSVIHYS